MEWFTFFRSMITGLNDIWAWVTTTTIDFVIFQVPVIAVFGVGTFAAIFVYRAIFK